MPTRAAPGTDPTTLREGTRHRRPRGVEVHVCDMSGTGSSMDRKGAHGGRGLGGGWGVTADGDRDAFWGDGRF